MADSSIKMCLLFLYMIYKNRIYEWDNSINHHAKTSQQNTADKMIQLKAETNKQLYIQICNPWTWNLSPWERCFSFSFSFCRMTAFFFPLFFVLAESFNSEGHEIACNKHKRDELLVSTNNKKMHWMKMMDLANFQFFFLVSMRSEEMDERAFDYYAKKTDTFRLNHYIILV